MSRLPKCNGRADGRAICYAMSTIISGDELD